MDRNPYLQSDSAKSLLSAVIREINEESGVKAIALVILQDHFHAVFDLHGFNLSKFMQSVKLRFARRFLRDFAPPGTKHVWQRRFWDHIIRDQADLNRHLDYIHYNPVKHGLVKLPQEYKYSTFTKFLEAGHYEPAWGCTSAPASISGMDSE
ncbi:MAG: transposase [Betaproteobacteria bacterium]|nr:transposase [Betaproteobacteria bacterium]